jgi:2-iminobutanoate/2-iminopropanoate deaminase
MRMKIIACAAAIAMASAAQAAPPRYIGANPDAVFSQAVQAGDFLILSGMLSGKRGTIEEEATGTMESIGVALKANGLGFGDVAKCTVMIKDMSEWDAFNKVYVTYFAPGHRPARSAFGAAALAHDAKVEVECWAYNPAKK